MSSTARKAETSVSEKNILLGIDIGGTKCAAICACAKPDRPEILGKRVFVTREYPWETMLQMLAQGAEDILSACGKKTSDIVSAGVSCGSPLNSQTGYILSPPNLPGWDAVPVTDFFARRFSVPCALQNDANAGALAEWRYGAGRGTRNMIFLTFGTGFGAGLILDGRLYSGTSDMAGEIGHVRIAPEGPVGFHKAGSMEGFCSGGGIAQLANGVDAKTVAERALQGEEEALKVIRTSASYLGRGLAILADLLNPERIVIGSIYARNEALFKETALEELKKEALPETFAAVEIVPAALGDAIGDYAALSIAETALETRRGG